MNLLVGVLFVVIGLFAPLTLKAAEDPLARWAGLWCSGRDEIGVFTRAADPNQTEPYNEEHHTD
jgi:hypothetical protein